MRKTPALRALRVWFGNAQASGSMSIEKEALNKSIEGLFSLSPNQMLTHLVAGKSSLVCLNL